ncbi:MAG: trk/ktr system potassium uptake protein [Clostridiales bacterium]|jgi:trk system potassium uptake protein TrkA|nr:trk/ktr system potassium uptake protein [Clostridiales bacterium]MDN5282516.1 trk/ktr system potassium uptake protein [Candidatus Ozemobacter sp.]
MAQQILVIGLGQFGMSLAAALTNKGAEVLAVDTRKNLVEEASSFVTEAVVMNAADETELAKLEPGKRDVAVCAIGEDSKESSIICTALLRQMGTPCVIARANNPMHQRILQLVGAHQIVNPEQEFGKRLANRLVYSHLIADMPLGDGLHLSEISVKKDMVGKSLIELALPKKFGIMVVAIRRGTPSSVFQPNPSEPLQENDNLVLVSKEEAIKRLMEVK